MSAGAAARWPRRSVLSLLSFRRRPASLFVWSIWALMFLGALAFVGIYARNAPFWDDWEILVPALAGKQPITVAWLWETYHEHRLPLPKLILLGLGKLTHCDFRSGMFFNAAVLGLLAAVMILAAKKLRGWTGYTDAALPLILLHWGHWANLTFFFTVHFISTTVLAGAVLSIIAGTRGPVTPRVAVLAAACLLLLPLTGTTGLIFVPPLALWLVDSGIRRWRYTEPQGRREGPLILGLATVTMLPVGLYFVGFRLNSFAPQAGLLVSLRSAIKFLSTGVGPIAISFWPYSGLLVLALLSLAAVNLAMAWRAQPLERSRVLGLILFTGAVVALGLGIGRGRATLGEERLFSPTYVTLAALTLCAVYFACGIEHKPSNRFAQAGLFMLMCLLLPFNFQDGLENGRRRSEQMGAFVQDLLAQTPPYLLAERHVSFLIPYQMKGQFVEWLRMLRDAGIGPYRYLPDDPTPQEIPFTIASPAADDMRSHPRRLTFTVDDPRFVYALRLKYSCRVDPGKIAWLRVSWKRDDRKEEPVRLGRSLQFISVFQAGGGADIPLEASKEDTPLTIPIYDKFRRITLLTKGADCVFGLHGMSLLVPPFERPQADKGTENNRSPK